MAGSTALLHAQSGIRFRYWHYAGRNAPPYGDEPNLITHLQTVAPHHAFYHADQRHSDAGRTIKRNCRRWFSLSWARSKPGCGNLPPMPAATICARHRLYGAPVGSGEISRRSARARIPPVGEEAARNTRIPERQPRVVSHEQQMRLVSKIIAFCVDKCAAARHDSYRAAICARIASATRGRGRRTIGMRIVVTAPRPQR